MGLIYGLEALPKRAERYEVVQADVVADCDVCVIGSGAAGAVMAKELVEQGKRVVLLERGGYYEGQDMNQRDMDMMPLLWKNGGFQFDDALRIAIAQGSCLGGSTIINDAVCFDTPARVRQEWRALGLTFTDAEWDAHLQKVNRTLGVTDVADDELNRNNRALQEGAKALGLREHRKNKRNCVHCMQCGFCHLGCHYDTKRNVLVTYLHEALQKPDAAMRAYCNCCVERLVHRGGVVEGVEGSFRNADGGEVYRIRVNAKAVVLAAGAIASSKLLLRNNIAQSTAGRGLALHPAPFVIGDFDGEIKSNQGVPMAYTVHDFGVTRTSDASRQAWGIQDGEFLLESVSLPLIQFSMAIPTNIAEHRLLLQRFNHYAMAGVLTRDGPRGRVSLTATGRASVAYELGPRERRVIAKGVEVLARMWFKLGARRILTCHRDMLVVEREDQIPELVARVHDEPHRLVLGSAHPQSGNAMGTDPQRSVVDPDGRVHGFRNLFVCDASVFPTAVGVNPQVTVMALASMVAARIGRDWAARYQPLALSASLGATGDLRQPWFCDRATLSKLFDGMDTRHPPAMLVNSASEKLGPANWSFDHATLTVRNDTRWKGLFPRDGDAPNTITTYAGGFWKRFTQAKGGVEGITHPFELPVFAPNRASEGQLPGFGQVVLLEYTQPPFTEFFDVLKIVDEHTILGKAFFTAPQPGREILTFSMARRYPLEFCTEDDHDLLYAQSAKPAFATLVGIWEGQLVSDAAWSPPLFRFRYYMDGSALKCDYVFGNTLAGTARVTDHADHLEMHDATGAFHDELRQVNADVMIGKYYAPPTELARWVPDGLSFLHIDRQRPAGQTPYVIKRVGAEGAYREYP
ncbi:MAG TPA: GMC family oxidoreductase [Candidatus Thermoplasmatota archaeon]|nr:GMC family oxidoreductase [Candidatus Thermoplasmatota archaeon]